jgi:hypothetical protein
MADLKISQLTSATLPLAGTEVLPIVQSSSTKKVATDDLTVKNVRSNATTGILQIAGPAAAATRTMTVPDANFTAARTDAAQSFTGDQTLGTGNLIQGTAAKGVNFTANTPAAGMTSQLLNWYEEGTWTPSVGGDATYFAQTGRYTRVGRLVTFTATLYINLIGTGSTTTISGLPFTASQRSAVSFGEIGGLATSVVALYGLINSGATTISIRGATAASAANASITAFQNVTYLDFCGQYTV